MPLPRLVNLASDKYGSGSLAECTGFVAVSGSWGRIVHSLILVMTENVYGQFRL